MEIVFDTGLTTSEQHKMLQYDAKQMVGFHCKQALKNQGSD